MWCVGVKREAKGSCVRQFGPARCVNLYVLTCVWSGCAPFGFGLPETSPEEQGSHQRPEF